MSSELRLPLLGAFGSCWAIQLRPAFLLLLPQVFESSNQSSYNESTCKDLLPKKRRRTRIPDKPNYSLNLWSIMKNCIGKELSKIPMPVSERVPGAEGWWRGCCRDAGIEGLVWAWLLAVQRTWIMAPGCPAKCCGSLAALSGTGACHQLPTLSWGTGFCTGRAL